MPLTAAWLRASLAEDRRNDPVPAWDGRAGTAGGIAFAQGLERFARERGVSNEQLAQACGISDERFARVLSGKERLGVSGLAALTRALRSRPIEFLQRCAILSLDLYAFGLDPLYFLPEGPIRYDARIYMREINPRHAVPEADMTRRNPTLKALADDAVLDALGKIEVELAYLLRAAVQQTDGTL